MPGVNKVLYNLDQRGETTPEERTTARRNIDAISADEVAVLFDDHYKVKQSPINMTFAANAVLRRLWQNPNGEIGAECNYIYDATQSTSGFMSPADKTKLDGIAYGAEVNVQSDWNTVDETLDSYIWNKPDLSIFATRTELDGRLQGKQDKLTPGNNITIDANNVISATAEPQQNADWNATSGVTEILNKPQNLVQDPDYVHTDNNFSDADKTKLAGIEAGAEVNVKPDWDAVAGSDAEILNKPQNLVQDADYHHTDNNYTTADKNKLAGIEAGAEVNVNADWNAVAGSDAEILNKPDLSVYATKTEVATDLADKQDKLTAGSNITITNNVISATAAPQQQADWAQADSSAVDFIKNKPSSKPLVAGANISITESASQVTIAASAAPQVNADWNATSGVSEILNKPTDLVQDASYVHTDNNFTTAEKNKLAGIEAGAEVNVKPDWNAASGSDAEILNKPDLSVYATKSEVTSGLAGKQNTLTAGSNISIVGDTISATAAPQQNADWNATSGVTAILNKPDIPLLEWKQTTQGATNTYTSDHLTIHQDTHAVSMENATHTGDVDLGFVVPPVASAPSENMVLGMASGNTVPSWTPSPSVPQMKDLVAGDGISITSGTTEVEIAANITAGNGIVVTPGAGSNTVAWEYTVGRNLHVNQNNAIQTNIPGGQLTPTTTSGWQAVGGLASAYRIMVRYNTDGTYDLGLQYYASGTSSTFTFIGTEDVTLQGSTSSTRQSIRRANEATEYTNCAMLNLTHFNPANHWSLQLQGTLIAGTLHDFRGVIWKDYFGDVQVAFTAVEVGKVGATN